MLILKWPPILLFTLLPLVCIGQQPYIQVISSEQVLGNSPIHMIMEDHKGIVWAATELGLIRFDGLEVKVYLPEKGNPNSIPHELVYYLFEDKHHYIWIATRNGLTSLDPTRKIFKRYFMDSSDESTIPNNRIYSLLPYTDSTFFVICDQSGLASFNIHTQQVTRLNPTLHSKRNATGRLLYAYKTINNKLLIGTGQGLFEYDRQFNVMKDINDTITEFHTITGKHKYFCDEDGKIWFADAKNCIYQWIPYQSLTGMDSPELCGILSRADRFRFFDYSGDQILIAAPDVYLLLHKQSGEISRLEARQDQENLLYDDPINAVLEIENNIIVMGSLKGNLYLINPLLQKFNYRKIAPNLYPKAEYTNVNDIFEDPVYQKRYVSANLDSSQTS